MTKTQCAAGCDKYIRLFEIPLSGITKEPLKIEMNCEDLYLWKLPRKKD